MYDCRKLIRSKSGWNNLYYGALPCILRWILNEFMSPLPPAGYCEKGREARTRSGRSYSGCIRARFDIVSRIQDCSSAPPAERMNESLTVSCCVDVDLAAQLDATVLRQFLCVAKDKIKGVASFDEGTQALLQDVLQRVSTLGWRGEGGRDRKGAGGVDNGGRDWKGVSWWTVRLSFM